MTKQEKAAAIEDLTAALKGLKNLGTEKFNANKRVVKDMKRYFKNIEEVRKNLD